MPQPPHARRDTAHHRQSGICNHVWREAQTSRMRLACRSPWDRTSFHSSAITMALVRCSRNRPCGRTLCRGLREHQRQRHGRQKPSSRVSPTWREVRPHAAQGPASVATRMKLSSPPSGSRPRSCSPETPSPRRAARIVTPRRHGQHGRRQHEPGRKPVPHPHRAGMARGPGGVMFHASATRSAPHTSSVMTPPRTGRARWRAESFRRPGTSAAVRLY